MIVDQRNNMHKRGYVTWGCRLDYRMYNMMICVCVWARECGEKELLTTNHQKK